MQQQLFTFLIVLALVFGSLGQVFAGEGPSGQVLESGTVQKAQEKNPMAKRIKITVGKKSMTAVLENNASAEALLKLIGEGTLTVKGSNFGGFEKVCSLGASLVKNDTSITTRPGDIVLYQGKSICFYYAENRWDFTPLGHVEGLSDKEIREILSGPETEVSMERIKE